jgi:stage II sporulation protein D
MLRRRAKGIAAIVLAGTLLAALAMPAPASAARWTVRGHGFGHGVGMSQYGAYGYAKHGKGYRAILKHYYRHTKVGRVAKNSISVLLASGQSSVAFRKGRKACGKRLRPKRRYRFAESRGRVTLQSGSGRKLAGCGRSGAAKGRGGILVEGKGVYRGKLKAKLSGGGLVAVNKVSLDDYARGVIANEMPSSWPRNALRAQAVATRSYGLAAGGGDGFDVYDDTRSQVYGGKDSETQATDRAVRRTANEVVRYRKQVIATFFFSTSGGRTESVQFAFGSEPVPYLKSVRDRYDRTSPYHKWKVHYSQGEMESKLSGLFGGRLKKVKVTKTGDSPRIVRARIVGSRSSSRVSGGELQGRLGLMSTWARFHKR